ncbi:MAG: glutamine-hydrolyzing carbamoyl-phosphate synthase small subunit [Candidatus Marinimicrobia bacterium]|nr:glutamine-hydrolyzing carbamoyl-phosphate synthase small subunit [Candidatus Neomarinimicrobiota bacterium]
MQNRQPAILFLEDGRFFSGFSFGSTGETTGELCFNTGMTGYQEVLTDPSYCKQIVTMTNPHIGNYGINPADIESDRVHVAGFIIKEETKIPSNWQSTQSLGDYLYDSGIVGLKGIDTRALTKHLRNNGAMNGIISTKDFDHDSLRKKVTAIPSMTGQDLTQIVTCRKKYKGLGFKEDFDSTSQTQYTVAALDFGIKWNILQLLDTAGCDVTVYPANTSAYEILSSNPDGVFLSNGPGDPAAATYAIDTVKRLLGQKPIFGICLGHQILALALGAQTYKLKYGHRGLNHPVKRLDTGQIEITSQNHGFAVDLDSLPKNVVPTHINLNDGTCEGIRCTNYDAFSVQYHPESSPGPHDSRYLFQSFTDMIEKSLTS